MNKKQDKRKSNDERIKEQLSSTTETKLEDGVFTFHGALTISDFAEKTKKSPSLVISYFFKNGKIKTINTFLNEEEIAELCLEFNLDFKKEDIIDATNYIDKIDLNDFSDELVSRPPIVTIMGHVDHGKTTLIDQIRKSNVLSSEFGGITQHTGAYQVVYNKKKITFLDTPGHEAFTEMRARGAKVTDIVVLVVAADDGVKPQTVEAIDHAKAANVPIIVFVNKIDKPTIDLEKVKSQLSENNIICEEWGGDVQFIYGSAMKNKNIDQLLEAIFLQAELLDLKASLNRDPIGTIIESKLDKGKGVVSTVIVQNGTLYPRDFIVAGGQYGNIRSLLSFDGKPLDKATPGMPCIITGLNHNPAVGDKFIVLSDEKFAKKLADERAYLDKQQELSEKNSISIQDGMKVINVLIKADVQGTAEAIKNAILKIKNEEVAINVIRATAGEINKADVILAEASNARIYTFNNSNINSAIKSLAEQKKIKIIQHNIIYKIIEELTALIKTLKEPVYVDELIGSAQVIQLFYYSKVGTIAGCRQLQGVCKEFSKVEVYRKEKLIHKGVIETLKREKNDVKIVEKGFEFGTHIKDFDKIEVDDELKFYEEVLKDE
ncbi:translation initiation factor IF-2 [Metamycoplasma hyosynoviae]|uniref:translation initiation factor IF-2 n=1 Tax=Metamycoplasma hyosynoviae TaxID=29559 RepID=UPI000461A96F|nr:translation initiation factor IF-2 [Metamycoplasma hyosynoviae]KDE42161.1 translation initiation factor IF-2 [Metamycoplasma hyosynoviae]KDE42232.1 translation initiation factor IF-2 [Metamycoplasma hyosynoviae]KDE43965.1 translation initiation factor IF-2 [Metamycoplasma hyosynoviae]KDE44044.1 translation initiation factor IF-2 [Metamycoplasma hyosynoviae]MDC8920109.1 translation initiation factor IF-2 [Metamycoplasma hyosynoviae]